MTQHDDSSRTIGPISLAVADLRRATEFYSEALGLRLLDSSPSHVALGIEAIPLVILELRPGAKRDPSAPGLFHLAILLPSRTALAAQLQHLLRNGIRLHGASDHLVSEALYLADPEGNGIEIYCDRPRSDWPYRSGQLQMATDPLDLDALLAAAPPGHLWDGLPAGTIMGHIHLQVSDVPAAVDFYRDIIGLRLTTRYGASAAFLSFHGYHHHLAVNCWNSRGATTAPLGSLGLIRFTLRVGDAGLEPIAAALLKGAIPHERHEAHGFLSEIVVSDPSGNRLQLES